ncbi:MAG: L,D-transpeptidase [Anaerolineales bacterium]|nr:L,D-transpeptidase [Anaerolineales bacterium]
MTKIPRRTFLKMTAAGIPALGARTNPSAGPPLPVGRVAAKSVDVHAEPDQESPVTFRLLKDTLIEIRRTVETEEPKGNPRWLQVEAGYLHSGDIQPVEFRPQIPVWSVPEITPAEVSVPITQSYRKISPSEEILYRLYYQSVHWVKDVVAGERNEIWYVLRDHQLGIDYYAPGKHLRLLDPWRYAPVAGGVAPWQKRIEVNISAQTLTAFEDNQAVREMKVSSGIGGKNASTPRGVFHIQIKIAGVHMGNGQITSDPLAYELPGVPWVCHFETLNGVAFHGAYWHNDFGRPRSHGCINLRPADALWLYRWSNPPAAEARIRGTGGLGTRVVIR